ncbi:MAG: hypothetical protein KTR26_17930, partial [Flammeovirgaceae bacterium]|nr:hypothetical protein [Flammeovirgaceae bacterium]
NISANSITSDGKLIYLIGDYSNLKLFMIFNPATYETQTFHTNFNCRFAGAAVMENKLYVFGGLGMDMPHDYSNRLYYLDLSKLSL